MVATAFGNTLQLRVTDSFGNPAAGVPVTFMSSGTGADVNFGGSNSTQTASDGVAKSPMLTAGTVAGSYTVTAIVGSLGQVTFHLENKAANASVILVNSGADQSATVNTAYAKPIRLQITDAYGNPVSNASVSFAAPQSGASVTPVNSGTLKTDSQGFVSSPALKANTVAGTFIVNVTSGNLSKSVSLTNLSGEATQVTVTGGNAQKTAVNTLFTDTLQVQVKDVYGNPVPDAPVTYSVPESGAGVIITGSNATFTDASGVAKLANLKANTVAGSFTVQASVPNLSNVKFDLENTPGSPAFIQAASGSGQSVVVNGSLPNPIQARVVDSWGNPISGVPVTFSVPSGGATLSLTTSPTVITNSSGLVQVTGKANGLIGSYQVTASVPGLNGTGFSIANVGPSVQALIVQDGATSRSFVRYVDIVLNDVATVNAIVSSINSKPRITMTNTGARGTGRTNVNLRGLAKAVGNTIRIDFGSRGIGGNATSSAADGSYLISLDMDGNGTLESTQRFHRLLGDVNGDKVVDLQDTALVRVNMNKVGLNIPGDVDGSGKVDSRDLTYVQRAQRRKINV